MRTALITGVAGFIGSHIAEALIDQGFCVVGIDNESTGKRENVPNTVNYFLGDVLDNPLLDSIFNDGIDVVFHLSGLASTVLSFVNPNKDIENNVIGTLNIIKLCQKHRVSRVLYASSMTCYGHPTRIPVKETENALPISYYGISKYTAERYLLATAMRNDLNFPFNATCFRMFNVYGERQRLDNPYQGVLGYFIGNLLRNEPIIIHSDGEQTRDFIYIKDVVNAWITTIDNEDSYNEVFNIGFGQSISINLLVDTLLKSINKNRNDYNVIYGPERPGDQRFMAADISKALKILAWQPQYSLLDGLTRTINWAKLTFEQQL